MSLCSKRKAQPKRKHLRKPRQKVSIHKLRKHLVSKLALLEKAGLIGCLTGTGVTSKNYKDIL